MGTRSYSDDELAAALSASRSWRGVLRALGLVATSAGSARSVRRHADRLGLSYDHFTGQRRWTDAQLRTAVGCSTTWLGVAKALGLAAGGGTLSALHAHCLRLQLPTEHLGPRAPARGPSVVASLGDVRHVRDAGTYLAAAWFTLRGAKVSWPLEPCRYDLLVDVDATLHRIQVKTSTGAGGDALVLVSNSRPGGRAVYAPDEIDWFFVVDAELCAYLIPYTTVAGLSQLKLSRYAAFRVAERGDLISGASSPAPAPRSRSGFP